MQLVSLELSGHVHERHGEARIPDTCLCLGGYQSRLLLDFLAPILGIGETIVCIGGHDCVFFFVGKRAAACLLQGKLQARYCA